MIALPIAAACAGAAGVLLLPLEPRHGGPAAIAGRALMLAPLALQLAAFPGTPGRVALAAALVVALLARRAHDAFHTECALKVMWVVGAALALSMAGCSLIVAVTGTPAPTEQWGILGLGLDPPMLWRAALPLTLIAGLVLLGAAPFHFWPSDVLQGAFPALAPLAVAALQIAGAGWLQWRLEGVGACPDAAVQSATALEAVSAVGFLVGAATLLVQRQPERRVGAMAGLQGALLLAAFAANVRLSDIAPSGTDAALARWAAHLALAVMGAGILARFTPAATPQAQSAAVIYRRHPWAAAAGLYAQLSLAGVPGTPGSLVWFAVARDVLRSSPVWLPVALIAAWTAAFVSVIRHARAAAGVRNEEPLPIVPVPLSARLALFVCGLPLLAEFGAAFVRK